MPGGNVMDQGLRPRLIGGCLGRGDQRCLAVVITKPTTPLGFD